MKNVLCVCVFLFISISYAYNQDNVVSSYVFGNQSYKTDDENDVIKMKTETTVFICRSEEEEEREMMNEILKDVWKVGNYDVIVKSELKDYLEKPGMVYASYELIAESYKAGALQSQNKMGINEFIPMIRFWTIKEDKKKGTPFVKPLGNIKLMLDRKTELKAEEIERQNNRDAQKTYELVSDWVGKYGKYEAFNYAVLKLYLGNYSKFLLNQFPKTKFPKFSYGVCSADLKNILNDTLYIPESMFIIRNSKCLETNKMLNIQEEIEDYPGPCQVVSDDQIFEIVNNSSEKAHYVLICKRNKFFEVYNTKTFERVYYREESGECDFNYKALNHIYQDAEKIKR